METVIRPIYLQLSRVPGIRGAVRFALKRIVKRKKDALPGEVIDELDTFFVHDLIGNIDTNDDGRADSFRIAITNGWFYQGVTAVQMTINGRTIPPESLLVDNGFATTQAHQIRRLRFEPGHAFSITAKNTRLGSGLNFIGIELTGELADVKIPIIPVLMRKKKASIPLLSEPWDPALLTIVDNERPAKIHFVPHVHYDFEWLRTEDRFARVGVGNLIEAIRFLDRTPEATFVVDQVPQLEALRTESPKDFEKLVAWAKQGRVEPVLGGYVEPDTNLPCGEALIRQFALWQSYAKKTFGAISTTAWLIDSFGMNGQLPQILRKCGANSLFFSRRRPKSDEIEVDFIWRGIDRTKIRAHHLPHFYFAAYPLDADPERAIYRLHRLFKKMIAKTEQESILFPYGVDHGRPQAIASTVRDDWNRRFAFAPMAFSTPKTYSSALNSELFGEYTGEMNGELTGVNAARIELKQLSRKAESLLLTAECLGAAAAVSGRKIQDENLEDAWINVLKSHFHDSVTGCNTDSVAKSVAARFELAGRDARKRIEVVLNDLGGVLTQGREAIFVFNPTGRPRTEMVRADMYAVDGRLPLLTDGKTLVRYQALSPEHYHDGADKRSGIVFKAKVPAFGYRIYFATNNADLPVPEKSAPVIATNEKLENGDLQIRLDRKTGAIKFAVHKPTGRLWELRSAGLLSLRKDRGTLYQEFRTGRAKKQKAQRIRVKHVGPFLGSVEVVGVVGKSRFTTVYTLHAESAIVHVKTKIDFADPGFSLFADATNDQNPCEVHGQIPFGHVRKGQGSHIAQDFVHLDYKPGKSLTVLNRGIPGYHLIGKSLKLALHRSVNKIHFFDAGNGAFGLGRKTFEYALAFTDGRMENAAPWNLGASFGMPLVVKRFAGETAVSSDIGRATRGFAQFDKKNIAITNVGLESDGTLRIRCYEAMGEPTDAVLHFGFSPTSVQLTDMLGNKVADLPVSGDKCPMRFRAFEIKTLKVAFKA